jgi:hypothetical protein
MKYSTDTEEVFKRFEELKKNRANFESHWQEVAERVLTRSAEFTGERSAGDKRTALQYDASAALALERFAAAVESLLTPRGSRWHGLRASNPYIDQNDDARMWFDMAQDILFRWRGRPKANFASQMHEGYMSLGAFGNSLLFVDEDPGGGMRYRNVHLMGCYIAEDEMGNIDTVFRVIDLAARQVLRLFADTDISTAMKNKVEKEPDARVKILHVVMPRTDRDPSRKDKVNLPWFSAYYEVDGQHRIEEGGFSELPYIPSRYTTGPSEVYGRSPAMTVLPDIKMLNEMSKTVIRAGQKVVDPPLLIADDGVVFPVNTKPGGSTFARLDGRSQAPVQPLQTGARVDIGLDMMEQRRRIINDAFLVTLFQILVETPSMTATEVLQRAQEKGALLAPTVGRQQAETLGPLIQRELAILQRQQLLPPMPDILIEAEGEYEIEYTSPLSRAMRAEEGVAILRTLEMVQPIAAMDPSVMDNFDSDKITRILAETNGAPMKIMRRQEDIAAVRETRAQNEQMSTLVQGAPQAADAALKVAQISDMAQQTR